MLSCHNKVVSNLYGHEAALHLGLPGDGGEDWQGHGRPSYYEDLSTRWPDFRDDMPVRPAVVAITKQGGGKIG